MIGMDSIELEKINSTIKKKSQRILLALERAGKINVNIERSSCLSFSEIKGKFAKFVCYN